MTDPNVIFDTAVAIAEIDIFGSTEVKHPAILRSLREHAPWPITETDLSERMRRWLVVVEKATIETSAG